MALVTVPITEKDRQAYVKSVLINTLKVCDFKNDSGSCVFHYEKTNGERTPSVEFKTSYSKNTFHTLIRQATNERWFNVQVLTERTGNKREKTVNEVKKIDSNRVIWAENVGTTQCDVTYARTAFEVVIMRCSHTIADLNRAESNSASLSAS
jgi:hypothetical protein